MQSTRWFEGTLFQTSTLLALFGHVISTESTAGAISETEEQHAGIIALGANAVRCENVLRLLHAVRRDRRAGADARAVG